MTGCLDNRSNGPVAQWIARRTSNPEVVGSSPTGVVAHILLKCESVQLQLFYPLPTWFYTSGTEEAYHHCGASLWPIELFG